MSSFPENSAVGEACRRGLTQAEKIIERAQEGGRLRPDFEPGDLAILMRAMSQVIRESIDTAPQAWRRHLAFFLDGLRAEKEARPVTS